MPTFREKTLQQTNSHLQAEVAAMQGAMRDVLTKLDDLVCGNVGQMAPNSM